MTNLNRILDEIEERDKLSKAVYILTEALSQYAIQGTFHHYEDGIDDIEDYGKVACIALREVSQLLKDIKPYERL